jgi:hypothetical protein
MGLPVYHNVVTSISNSAYNDTHRYDFGISSLTIVIHFRSGTNPITYSFNGTDDHGTVGGSAGYIQTMVLEPMRAHSLWLKGGTGDETVEITVTPVP